jgi:hypothetical protein
VRDRQSDEWCTMLSGCEVVRVLCADSAEYCEFYVITVMSGASVVCSQC